jgi:hypothetical protein
MLYVYSLLYYIKSGVTMNEKDIKEILVDTLLIDIRTGEEMKFITYDKFKDNREAMCAIFPGGTVVWIDPQFLKVKGRYK